MLLRPELIPVLARNCVNRVKVLRGVEIHGDRRGDLEDALVKFRSADELPKIRPDCPILVQLCLDLLHSSDFAEVEATDAELVPALQAALADVPRTFTDRLDRALRAPRPRLPPALPSQTERRSAREWRAPFPGVAAWWRRPTVGRSGWELFASRRSRLNGDSGTPETDDGVEVDGPDERGARHAHTARPPAC
ncbi:MAG TPA: hypothetical protein VFI53_21065 [Myxococcaceae bacterium]|nr:hypothetical protein [Myxococcaceae bacterium]